LVTQLSAVDGRDWSQPAGSLAWSCRDTADHLIDCIFSYAFQLSARCKGDFLPFQELHASSEATNRDLVVGLLGIGRLFAAVLRATPEDVRAGDGVVELDATGWAQRGAYELVLHTYDILHGLGEAFEPPPDLCEWVLGSKTLWMLDTRRASEIHTPWKSLLVASGRPVA
jgi:hypothetical protein